LGGGKKPPFFLNGKGVDHPLFWGEERNPGLKKPPRGGSVSKRRGAHKKDLTGNKKGLRKITWFGFPKERG